MVPSPSQMAEAVHQSASSGVYRAERARASPLSFTTYMVPGVVFWVT